MKTKLKKIIYGVALTASSLATTLKAQNIYVVNFGAGFNNGGIGVYGLNGQTINAELITNVYHPIGIAVSGTNLYVVNDNANSIAEYTTSGTTVNTNLISRLQGSDGGIAILGTNLFVANQYGIGEYTTSGETVNADLIPDVQATGIVILGTNLFVANGYGTTVGEYTTSGATVNASLISGFDQPFDIAISGTNLFVLSHSGSIGIVGEYTTSGATVNALMITNGDDNFPYGIANLGTNLYVVYYDGSNVGEYTTSGVTVKASLISGLDWPWAIAIGPAPPGPQLNIATVGSQSVLFYPAEDTNYVLQYVTNVASTNWLSVTNGMPITGVSVPNNLPASFFRLAPSN
jgi:hypothetical protein